MRPYIILFWIWLVPLAVAFARPDGQPYINYLNGLKALQGDFIQENPDGSVDEGQFYLHRPGRLRLDYAAPNRLQIVVNGEYFVQYDRGSKEANYLATADTPAAFLLQPHIKLKDNGVHVKTIQRHGGLVLITLGKDDVDGTLTLVFDPHPIRLRQWIVESGGQATKVTLQNMQTVTGFQNNWFAYPG